MRLLSMDRPDTEWTLKKTLLAPQEERLLCDWPDIWKWKDKRKKIMLCSLICVCFLNGWCFCLNSEVNSFYKHGVLLIWGSLEANLKTIGFVGCRLYIFSNCIWDTELLSANTRSFDCFNELQRLWIVSSDYCLHISHDTLHVSKAVKGTTGLVLFPFPLKLLNVLSVPKLLGHLRQETLPELDFVW